MPQQNGHRGDGLRTSGKGKQARTIWPVAESKHVISGHTKIPPKPPFEKGGDQTVHLMLHNMREETASRTELLGHIDQPLDLSAIALTILLCAIWGGAFVAIKVGTMDMPPLGAGAIRFLLTSLVLTGWAYYKQVPMRFEQAEVTMLLILGVLFLYTNVAAYVGTSRTTYTPILVALPTFLAQTDFREDSAAQFLSPQPPLFPSTLPIFLQNCSYLI